MKDWRGIDIVEGATVLYGVTSGHSINLVEGVVESVDEDKQKARVRIVRRKFRYNTKPVTAVGNANITVVTLPESHVKTMAEVVEDNERQRAEYKARQAACEHDWVTSEAGIYNRMSWRQCKTCRKVEYL